MLFAKSRLSLLALTVLVSTASQAQDLPAPLVEAARKAVASNPEVQARWNGFQAAVNERDVARGGYLPQVDLTASIGRENRKTPLVNYGEYNFNSQQLTLSQMLFDGRFTASEVKRLGYASLTRYYELAEVSETVALEAVRAYLDVVRYRELVEIATENYIEHKQSAMQVDERARAGVGRGADLEQANGRLALAESNLLTELTNLHDVSARYLRIIGETPPDSLPGLPDPFTLGPLPGSVDALMRDGLQGSPTINAAFENVRAYKTAIQTRRSAYLPRVDLRAYQAWEKNTDGIIGDTDQHGVQMVLNYNLFRGGADKARERQAVDQREQARDLQEKACRDVRQTLSIAYSDVRTLNEQLGYINRHRLSTEKSREAYRQQFDIGQRTLLDLLDSQNEYFEASRSYINARYNQIAAQARTLAGMGRLVAALGVNRSDVPGARDAGQDRDGIDPAELCPREEFTVETLDAIKARYVTPTRTPRSYVVLLPSPDGSVGKVVVTGQHGEQWLTEAQKGTPLDGSTPPSDTSKEELERDFGAAIAARPALPEQFLLYFVRGKAELTAESKALLPVIVERARARNSKDMSVIGHTDTVDKTDYNQDLGQKRADAMTKHLRELGLTNVTFVVESHGEQNLLVPTPDETDEPRNRRVEITVR
ncbi:MAG: TolC family outer membrane protein [Thiobacillus sp.]